MVKAAPNHRIVVTLSPSKANRSSKNCTPQRTRPEKLCLVDCFFFADRFRKSSGRASAVLVGPRTLWERGSPVQTPEVQLSSRLPRGAAGPERSVVEDLLFPLPIQSNGLRSTTMCCDTHWMNTGKSPPSKPCLGLLVIALPGAGGQAGLRYLNLDMVIFVGMLGARGIEGQLVVSLAIRHALLQHSGEVVAAGKGKTSTLNSKHLQGEIADHDLTRLTDALEETLIVELRGPPPPRRR